MSGVPFTYTAYAEHLALARELGFACVPFTHDDPGPGRTLYLRHDIDFSPVWMAPMARIEAREGARSTWFVQPDSFNYAIDDPAVAEAVATVLEAGGWLGAHVEANHLDEDDDVLALVDAQAAALAERFATEVTAVSFHMPGRRPGGYGHLALPRGLVNTYAPRFFDDVTYVSDSNQFWRGKDLAAELRASERLQLLVHPMWWREREEPMLGKLAALAEERGIALDDLLTPEQRALIDA